MFSHRTLEYSKIHVSQIRAYVGWAGQKLEESDIPEAEKVPIRHYLALITNELADMLITIGSERLTLKTC